MTSSSGDSAAPLDFQISSSTEDNCKLSVQTEDCPLCLKSRRNFHCKLCIRNGDFSHSATRYGERYEEFLADNTLLFYFQTEVNNWKKMFYALEGTIKHLMISQINMCKDRVRFLRLLIKDKKEMLTKKKERILRLADLNREHIARLARYEERVGKLENLVNSKCAELREQKETLYSAQEKLKKVIRKNVQQLVHYIFPISAIHPFRSHDDSDTVNALAEASRTAYIRGKWVFSDISTESQHCIVAPTLPSSGDYSPYNDWVAANKDGVPGASNDAVDHNPAYNISAALTYTTQLVNLLAFYLDIRLPTKLCYSEFCGNELSENKFAKRVARLNWNVLHLCLSQNVNPRLLNPKSTLQNILHLLDPGTSDLGRVGACEVDPETSRALEDSLRPALELSTDSEDSEDDSDHLPYEWEAVANVGLPEVGTGPVGQNISSQQQISSTSVASGLVTSAAASIASFWRGWTTNRYVR
ncbi:hypothetical protein AAG570_007608 [Ranatra chinensis]|uniref:Beclin 1-associated autophagy-related key regulator n=1 Tax=Ranatra chinensis TaxID=642074 RepID=A0ABD0YCJ8_9HEMI